MQNEDHRPHIIEVNEGVIDLGKEIDRDNIPPLRNPYKGERRGHFNTTKLFESEPVLQRPKPRRRIPIPKDLPKPKAVPTYSTLSKPNLDRNIKFETPPSDGIKKFATEKLRNKIPNVACSSVSSSTVTAITKIPHSRVIRNKPILRSKVSNSRIPGADPRFRRTRSPSSKNHLTTQSELRVSPTTSEKIKTKSQSESKFLLPSQSDALSTTRMNIGKSKGDSLKSINKILLQKSDYSESKLAEKSDDPSSKISQDDKSKSVEAPTLSEATSLIGGTLYQSAVSGPSLKNEKPFWDDPRLIDKYGKLLKPVSLGPRNSLSSWTLPTEKPDNFYHRDVMFSDPQRNIISKNESKRQLLQRHCTKCYSTMNNNTIFTESTRTIPPYDLNKEKLYSLIYSNYLSAVFFALGSICGLLLVALVVWVVANDLAFTYFQKSPSKPKFTGMTAWVVYFVGGAIYGIIYICKWIGFMFTIPKNEVYNTAKIEPPEPWYSTLISWT